MEFGLEFGGDGRKYSKYEITVVMEETRAARVRVRTGKEGREVKARSRTNKAASRESRYLARISEQ